ncbi:MAG: ABC transporter substrate-binding protein [Alphaproteobacteria bacterium]
MSGKHKIESVPLDWKSKYGFRRRVSSFMGAIGAVGLFLTVQAAEAATLRMAHQLESGGAESVDPISSARFAETNITVYSRLVREDSEGRTVPDLATEWSASPDASVWTFKLRDGVTFHNGNDFTAEDVVFSLSRILSEKIDSPVKEGLSLMEKIEAADDKTVVVTLSSGHADFPLLLRDYRVRMVDSDACNNDVDAICESGIGTGPFKIVKLDTDGTTTLERFEDYWEGPAAVEAIEIIAIPDQQARIAALQAGQIDIIFGITGQQRALFEGNDNFIVQSIPTGGWTGLAMRTDTPPYDNPVLRKALRIAVDRDAMGKLVFGEGAYAISCDHPVWVGDPYRADIDCGPDPEKAKAMLMEEFGGDIPKIELFVSDVAEGAMKMAEVYQAQMKQIGVDIELVIAPSDGYWDEVWAVEPFFVTGWSERPADQILNEAYRSTAPWNESHFKNAAFDEALDKARQELDFDQRKKLYGDVQELLWNEGGTLIPFHQSAIRVMSSKVSGVDEVAKYAVRYQNIAKSE